MTEYFEVLDRDGAARLGELRLTQPTHTPRLADEIIDDAGSTWPTHRDPPSGSQDRLTILPHRAFPAGTDERIQTSFAPDYPTVEYPSAAVIAEDTVEPHGTDAYVLAGAAGIIGHASALIDAIITIRSAIPPDTALYLPGVATPQNAATLVYAGVDLLDTDRAVIRGTQGRYLTTDGEYAIDNLDELPCACPACQTSRNTFDRDDCVAHNTNVLAATLRTIRERIRAGRLRDYLEAQARHTQWCTAAMRTLDQEWTYLEERTPLIRRADMTAASEDTMRRVEIRRFADRVTSRYQTRFDAPLVLLPCSARKPYSDSQSYSQFFDAINYRGHIVSMTSPIGVVPSELELTYPAQHYDSVVTGRWTAEEIQFVAEILSRYLDRNEYEKIIAHVPPEGYQAIVERATDSINADVTVTVTDHPTTDDALTALSDALAGEPRYSKREREHNTVRAIADYQFGAEAGTTLFPDPTIKGRYPKHRVFDDETQLAALVPEYGVLALTLAGARRWHASSIPTLEVRIDDFVPHGSVLAPGITAASDDIRVGDEVIVHGPSAFGVGRAIMSGPEMTASSRGVAVDVRHVTEETP